MRRERRITASGTNALPTASCSSSARPQTLSNELLTSSKSFVVACSASAISPWSVAKTCASVASETSPNAAADTAPSCVVSMACAASTMPVEAPPPKTLVASGCALLLSFARSRADFGITQDSALCSTCTAATSAHSNSNATGATMYLRQQPLQQQPVQQPAPEATAACASRARGSSPRASLHAPRTPSATRERHWQLREAPAATS